MAAMLVIGNNIEIVITKLNLSKKTIKNKLIETRAKTRTMVCEQALLQFASLQSREKRKRKKSYAFSTG